MASPSVRDVLRGRSRAQRWRRTVARRVLAFLALASALVLTQWSLRSPGPATTAVAVAGRDLAAGTVLGRGDLVLARLPRDLVPSASSDPGHVLGRRLATPLARGEPVTPTRLVPRTLADGLPPGTTAVHVLATDTHMLELVGPGQEVRLHRPSDGAVLVERAMVLGVDLPVAGSGPALGGPDPRGLVVAVPTDSLTLLLLTPDGSGPRVHVLPTDAG